MSEAPVFRHYRFCQESGGQAFELSRSPTEVECLAFDTFLRRFVSFHVLTGENLNVDAFQRNLRELPLHHSPSPYLAKIIDGGDDEGTLFYVTRLIDGPTLDGYLGNLDFIDGRLAALLLHQIGALLSLMKDRRELLPHLEPRSFRLVAIEENRLKMFLTSLQLTPEQASPAGAQGSNNPSSSPAAVAEATRSLLDLVSSHGEHPSAPTMSGPEARGHIATILEAADRDRLGALEKLQQAIDHNHHDPSAFPVDPAFRPGRLLLRETPSPDKLHNQQPGSLEPLRSPGIKSLSYAYLAVDPPPGIRKQQGRTALQVFPPERLLPSEISAISPEPAGMVSSTLLPVINTGQEDGSPVISELAVNGFDLETSLAARGRFSSAETLSILEATQSALDESLKGNEPTSPPRLLPRDLFIHFDPEITSQKESEQHLTTSLDRLPPHRILTRVHASMDALTDGWSHCPTAPRADQEAGPAGGQIAQSKAPPSLCSELFICLACKLLGLPQLPASEDLLDSGLSAAVKAVLGEALASLEQSESTLPRELFLTRFQEAVRQESIERKKQAETTSKQTSRPKPETMPAGDDLFASSIENRASEEEQLGFAQALFQKQAPQTSSLPDTAQGAQPPARKLPEAEEQPGLGASLARAAEQPATSPPTSAPTLFKGSPADSGNTPQAAKVDDQADLAKILIASQQRRHLGENLLWLLILLGIAAGFFFILAKQGIIPERFNPLIEPNQADARDDGTFNDKATQAGFSPLSEIEPLPEPLPEPPPEALLEPFLEPLPEIEAFPEALPEVEALANVLPESLPETLPAAEAEAEAENKPGKVLRALRADESLLRKLRESSRPGEPENGS